MTIYEYFDYETKREVIYNEVNLGYFIDSKIICNEEENRWNSIKKIYVISLEYRDDRRIKLFENLKKTGICKITFFIPRKIKEISYKELQMLSGIFYTDIKYQIANYTVFACFLSHMICYKDAFSNDYQNIMLLEDDCYFYDIQEDVLKEINQFIDKEKFDGLYLHNNNRFPNRKEVIKCMKLLQINNFDYDRFNMIIKYPNLRIFLGVGLTHCLIFSKNYISKISNMMIPIRRNICKNIDYILHAEARTNNFYTTKNIYTSQIESFSDITLCVKKKGY